MTRKICPVCNGRGRIRNPKARTGTYIPYDNEIECPNCQGEGFVGIPDNISPKRNFYTQTKSQTKPFSIKQGESK